MKLTASASQGPLGSLLLTEALAVRAERRWITRSLAASAIGKALVAGLLIFQGGTSHAADDTMPSMDMNEPGQAKLGMPGMLGSASMQQEASGTSWQPQATPLQGIKGSAGAWMTMVHGYVNAVYSHQPGARGGDALFSTNMLMAMASRPLGVGTLGLRGMFSLEPSLGPAGYPLLLQSGESADGFQTLVDRQHPHDLFMELALTYSISLAEECSIFAYLGLPGEPALGPPAFMHRFSGQDDPVAALSHHWIDSTHVTEGVATLGAMVYDLKFDASAFRGREPDYNRWDIEQPRLDSWSGRLSYNPGKNVAFEASYGHLTDHDPLSPGQNEDKFITSLLVNQALDHGNWQTTLAWGRNMHLGEPASNAFLLESAANFAMQHTLFLRAETAEKDDLFKAGSPLSRQTFNVGEVTLGYIYDLLPMGHLQCGLGASGTVDLVPDVLIPSYGERPLSYLLFVRIKAV